MNFQTWFFDQLPIYFKKFDTYKDVNNRGLLERYLEIFGLELDNEVVNKIEGYMDIVDPLLADSQYLSHIAYTLGRPPDLFQNEPLYRRFLSIVLSIYKVKGTLKSYQALFAMFGYNIAVNVTFTDCTLYDDGEFYDSDPLAFYDTCCPPCFDYTIGISQQGQGCISSGPYTWDLTNWNVDPIVQEILCFLEPINLHLAGVYPAVFLCETYKGDTTEQVTGYLGDFDNYDENPVLLYDNGVMYDNLNTTPIVIVA